MDVYSLESQADGYGSWDSYARSGIGAWPPGRSHVQHSHTGAVEVFVVLKGSCDMDVEGEIYRLAAGQTLVVPPDVRHRLTAAGPDVLEIFMVIAPNHSPTHTFWRPDGTPAPYDTAPPGREASWPDPPVYLDTDGSEVWEEPFDD